MNLGFRIAAVAATACFSVVLMPAQDRPFDTALMRAVQQSDLAAVQRAIRSGANVNAADRSGASVLMQAAIYSNAACMSVLLEDGANPNAANQADATALMWSAGDVDKMRLLLAKGAAVNARAKSGRTALAVAARVAGNLEGVKLLLSRGADAKLEGTSVMLAAASSGDEAIVRAVLAAGGDPNEHARNGITPLVLAARAPTAGGGKLLVDAGADVNAKTAPAPPSKVGLAELGEVTPLHIAAAYGNAQLVRLLVNRGADVKARDMRGMTPLMMAAASEFQDEETVRILIAAGSDVRAEAKDGQTVTSWAEKWSPNGLLPLLKQHLTVGPSPPAPKSMEHPAAVNTRAAAEKALSLLQSSSVEFFRQSGCSGCHHQMLAGMAARLARQHGVNADESLAKEDVRAQVAVRMPERELLLQGVPVGGAPMAHSLLLVSLAAQDYPKDSFKVR